MQELYQEYKLLNKATQQLSPNEKQILVGLTMRSDWQVFVKMLNYWKHKIVIKGFTKESSSPALDMIAIKTQVKTISVLKTFQNKYKSVEMPQGMKEDDPALTVPLD